ncbi:hypothetical protein AB6A40_005550 [Gnathostoma spinigerum]|uniref:Uncharacterized protein n=1 Tax=Gnathostoma spinigerum TaxID=75299 RepID=A0ABD6EHY4_9BILA
MVSNTKNDELGSLHEENASNYGSYPSQFHCHSSKEDKGNGNLRAKRVLLLSLCVCLVFMICEVVDGTLADSLAIITDAAHIMYYSRS